MNFARYHRYSTILKSFYVVSHEGYALTHFTRGVFLTFGFRSSPDSRSFSQISRNLSVGFKNPPAMGNEISDPSVHKGVREIRTILLFDRSPNRGLTKLRKTMNFISNL